LLALPGEAWPCCKVGLWRGSLGLVEDEGDASGDEIAGGFSGGKVDEFDLGSEGVGPKDETVGEEVGIANGESAAVADGEEIGAVGAVGVERVVVAIDEGDGLGEDEGVHGEGIGGGDADGDKSLPGAARVGGAGTNGLKQADGKMNPALRGGGSDVGLEQRGMMGDERDGVAFSFEGHGEGGLQGGQKVGSGEVLCGEQAVDGFNGELASAVEEVGEMGLPKTGLAGEQGDA